jgi:hypothetical protein
MKQAKIAIIVIGLLVGGFLIFRFFGSGGSAFDSSPRVINVLTGELSRMEHSRLSVIPYPDSEDRRVILPAMRNEEGVWVVAEVYRSSIPMILEREQLTEADLAIDPQTFAPRNK